jgi:hypothetical protein
LRRGAEGAEGAKGVEGVESGDGGEDVEGAIEGGVQVQWVSEGDVLLAWWLKVGHTLLLPMSIESRLFDCLFVMPIFSPHVEVDHAVVR